MEKLTGGHEVEGREMEERVTDGHDFPSAESCFQQFRWSGKQRLSHG
jgi:hypothetical protein